LTPIRFRGNPVFVGAISRDIGVYLTTRAWNLMTHAIDPNVDEARAYLIEDLATAQALKRLGSIKGVETATHEKPHRNLMNAPYWTDGQRAVLLLSDEPVPFEDIYFFKWTWKGVEWSQKKAEREEASAPSGIAR
jgi:hypothetical protein